MSKILIAICKIISFLSRLKENNLKAIKDLRENSKDAIFESTLSLSENSDDEISVIEELPDGTQHRLRKKVKPTKVLLRDENYNSDRHQKLKDKTGYNRQMSTVSNMSFGAGIENLRTISTVADDFSTEFLYELDRALIESNKALDEALTNCTGSNIGSNRGSVLKITSNQNLAGLKEEVHETNEIDETTSRLQEGLVISPKSSLDRKSIKSLSLKSQPSGPPTLPPKLSTIDDQISLNSLVEISDPNLVKSSKSSSNNLRAAKMQSESKVIQKEVVSRKHSYTNEGSLNYLQTNSVKMLSEIDTHLNSQDLETYLGTEDEISNVSNPENLTVVSELESRHSKKPVTGEGGVKFLRSRTCPDQA